MLSTMTQLFDFLKKIAKLLILFSKLIFICLTIYYIINVNIYKITLNVPATFRMFSIIDLPLKAIEFIGMSFLAIPLAIVIISFSHPEIRWLQILSNFFAVSGNLFSVGFLASKGLLEDYFRTRLFTIYNAPSLETKTSIFSNSFHEYIQVKASLIEHPDKYQSFIQNWMDKNGVAFYQTLIKTPISEIQTKALNLANELYLLYLASLEKMASPTIVENVNNPSTGISFKTVIITVVVIVVIAGAFYYLYNKIYKTAELTKQTAEEVLQNTNQVRQTVINTKELTVAEATTSSNVNNLSEGVSRLAEDVSQLATKTVNRETLDQMIENMKEGFNTIAKFAGTETERLTAQVMKTEEDLAKLIGMMSTLNNGQISVVKELQNLKKKISEFSASIPTKTSEMRDLSGLQAQIREFQNYFDIVKKIDVNQLYNDVLVKFENRLDTRVMPQIRMHVDTSVAEHQTKLTEIASKLGSVTNRQSTAEKRLETVNTRLETAEKQLKAVDVRLETAEKGLKDTLLLENQTLNIARENQTTLEAQKADIFKIDQKLNSQTTTLQEQTNQRAATTDHLKQQAEQFAVALDDQAKKFTDTLGNQTEKLARSIAKFHNDQINILNAQIAAQEDKIKLLENSMAILTKANISPSPSTSSSSFTSTLASASLPDSTVLCPIIIVYSI